MVPWREKDVGLLAKGKGDIYKPLCLISSKGLVVESPKINLRMLRLLTQKCIVKRGLLWDCQWIGMRRKLPSFMPHFVKELQNPECSVNYCNSNKKEGSQSGGWEMVC